MAKQEVFSKPARNADYLINQLRDRGVSIPKDNEVLSKHYIRSIGYFRLSGYFGPLQNDKDVFKDGTTFNDIVRLYKFDTKLKFLVFQLIEKFEIEFRTIMTDIFSALHGSFWYTDSELFKNDTTNIEVLDCMLDDNNNIVKQDKLITIKLYDTLSKEIQKSILKHKESVFMRAFFDKYDEKSPVPSWMVMEGISFGKLSRMYWLLSSSQEKITIANHFGAINSDYLTSWLHGLVVLRNTCAHHGRLWNRKLGKDIKIPTRNKRKFISCTEQENLRMFYGVSSCLLQIFSKIDEEEAEQFKENFFTLVEVHDIDYGAMGFPEDWKNDLIWQI